MMENKRNEVDNQKSNVIQDREKERKLQLEDKQNLPQKPATEKGNLPSSQKHENKAEDIIQDREKERNLQAKEQEQSRK